MEWAAAHRAELMEDSNLARQQPLKRIAPLGSGQQQFEILAP